MAVLFLPQQYGDPVSRVEARAVTDGRPILFDVELAILAAGEICGALEVLQDQPRSATWTACNDMTALILKKHIFLSQFPPSTLREIERVNNERWRHHQTRVARYIKTRFLADVAAVATQMETKQHDNNDNGNGNDRDDAATWIQQVRASRVNHSIGGTPNHSLSAAGHVADHYMVGHRSATTEHKLTASASLSSLSSPLVTANVPHALDRLYTLTSPDANAAPISRSIPARLADMFLDIKSPDQHHIRAGEPSLLAATPLSSSLSISSNVDGLSMELDRIQASLLDDRLPTRSPKYNSALVTLGNDNNNLSLSSGQSPLSSQWRDEWQPMAPSSPPPPLPSTNSSPSSSGMNTPVSATPPPLSQSASSASFASPTASFASPMSTSSTPLSSSSSLAASSHRWSLGRGVSPLTPAPSRPQSAVQLRSSSSSSHISRGANAATAHTSSFRRSTSSSTLSSSSPLLVARTVNATSPLSSSSIIANGDDISPRFLQATASSTRRASPTRRISSPLERSKSAGGSAANGNDGSSGASRTPSLKGRSGWSTVATSSPPSSSLSSSAGSPVPSLADQRKKLSSAIPSPAALRDLRMTLTGNLSIDVRNLLDREAREAEEARAADRLARSVEAPNQRRVIPDRSLHVRHRHAHQHRLRQHNRQSLTNSSPHDHHHDDGDDDGGGGADDDNKADDHDGNAVTEQLSNGDHAATISDSLPPTTSSLLCSPQASLRASLSPSSASSHIPNATAERLKLRAARTAAAAAAAVATPTSATTSPTSSSRVGASSSSSSVNGSARGSRVHSIVNTTIAPSGRPYGSLTKFALKLREKGRTRAPLAKDRVNKWEVDTFWRASW